MTNTTTTATDRADFSDIRRLRDFVERVATNLGISCYPNGERIDAQLVDFGADNLLRPPAITFAPELPPLMQPRVTVRFDARKNRITIGGAWPHALDGGGWGVPTEDDLRDVTHEISVSADKPAAQIARDIANRMLPTYLPLHKELQRRLAVHQQDARAAQDLAARLAVDGDWLSWNRDAAGFSEYLENPDDTISTPRAVVECRGNGSVKLTLESIDATMAAAVLALLRGGVK